MRLFVGIAPDAAAREAIAAVRPRLESTLGASASALTWTVTENLHVTLHFLGEVDGSRVEEIGAVLGEPVPEPPFVATTGRLGAFPERGAPRVIWLGVAGGAAAMSRLHTVCAALLIGLRLPVDERPFTPHFTLARSRERRGASGLRTAVARGCACGVVARRRRDALQERSLGRAAEVRDDCPDAAEPGLNAAAIAAPARSAGRKRQPPSRTSRFSGGAEAPATCEGGFCENGGDMQSDARHQAAVLGAGSWGTALAIHLGSAGRDVTLWGRDGALIEEMAARRANPTYLPDLTFPPPLRPVASIAGALAGARYVIVAVPSHGLRAVVRAAAPHIPAGAVLVSAAKGIEIDSLQRMSQLIAEETAGRHAVVVLSGPSFAAEVARQLPTALVAASADADAVRSVQDEFRGPTFRLYASDDVVGVEIGAALKNIIAIAAGVTESLQLGHNAMAALITRGLAEISRLSCAMGGRRETLAGLSGLGDLVLTCTGSLSRNRHVGVELGRGRPLDEILASMRMVAEGVRTTTAALALGASYGVELPIAGQMAQVLAGRCTPKDAVVNLMLRPQRGELDRVAG